MRTQIFDAVHNGLKRFARDIPRITTDDNSIQHGVSFEVESVVYKRLRELVRVQRIKPGLWSVFVGRVSIANRETALMASTLRRDILDELGVPEETRDLSDVP